MSWSRNVAGRWTHAVSVNFTFCHENIKIRDVSYLKKKFYTWAPTQPWIWHLPSPRNSRPTSLPRFTSITTFGSHKKEPKSLPQDTFHWLKIYLHCDCGWGSAPDPTGGALQHNIHTLVVFKGSASQQRRNGRGDRARGKGRGEEWRDRGREERGREEADFAPSCKNLVIQS